MQPVLRRHERARPSSGTLGAGRSLGHRGDARLCPCGVGCRGDAGGRVRAGHAGEHQGDQVQHLRLEAGRLRPAGAPGAS